MAAAIDPQAEREAYARVRMWQRQAKRIVDDAPNKLGEWLPRKYWREGGRVKLSAAARKLKPARLPGLAAQAKIANKRFEMTRHAGYTHRKRAADGHQIITKAEYNKITAPFLARGGTIIRGAEAARHLERMGATASYVVGGQTAFIRDDATISDVLEEMYHAKQEQDRMFASYPNSQIFLRREIDAQKQLIYLAERYNIPLAEMEVTKSNLAYYEAELSAILAGGD